MRGGPQEHPDPAGDSRQDLREDQPVQASAQRIGTSSTAPSTVSWLFDNVFFVLIFSCNWLYYMKFCVPVKL